LMQLLKWIWRLEGALTIPCARRQVTNGPGRRRRMEA
jgi:hypothetical protein